MQRQQQERLEQQVQRQQQVQQRERQVLLQEQQELLFCHKQLKQRLTKLPIEVIFSCQMSFEG